MYICYSSLMSILDIVICRLLFRKYVFYCFRILPVDLTFVICGSLRFFFEVVFVFNRYMFVFEVFLLLATFLVNSFDFVVFLICDVTYVLNVWYALIRVLGRPARESMFPSIRHIGGC